MHGLLSEQDWVAVLNEVFNVPVNARAPGRVTAASINFDDSKMSFVGELQQLISKL